MDPHKVTNEIPVISFKPKPKPKKVTKVEEAKKVEPVTETKPVVKVKPVVEDKPVAETKPVVEDKPKKTKLVPGSDEAKAWGIAMKAKRDAKKALKAQEQTEQPLEASSCSF